MKLSTFNAICRRQPGVTSVVQWSGSRVYKRGGKMFALANQDDAGLGYFVLKTTPASFGMLVQQAIAQPAPHLPRGGWVKIADTGDLSDDDLAA